ncbi:MAG TPA: membrane dipeptidase [Streptosporangiaceae bacterium]
MSRGPWIDVHAHPGRCFLAGLSDSDPLGGLLGGQDVAGALAAARAAGLAAITLSTVADLRVLAPHPDKGLRVGRAFRPGEARVDHRRQLDGICRAVAAAGLQVASTAASIEAAHAARQTAVLLSCEGGDFLEGRLEPLAEARAAGASSLTLVHYRVNDIGDVQTEEPVHGGLTQFGRQVVAECNRLGVIVDCAHATFATTADVLAQSSQPVMVSHSHLDHADRHHPRLLSAAHARSVASAGGLIGAWPSGVTSASLADFADEVIRLADLIGVDHVAIGTDLDANYRPVLTSYGDFARLPELLAARGVGDADTDLVLGGNALALLRRVAG